MYICIYIHMHIHMYIYICMYIYMYTYTYAYVYVCIYAYEYIWMYTNINMYMYVYVYVYMYISVGWWRGRRWRFRRHGDCSSRRARDGRQDVSSWGESYCMPYVGAYACSCYVCIHILSSTFIDINVDIDIHVYAYIRICIYRARDGHQDVSPWRTSYCMPYVGAHVWFFYVCICILSSIFIDIDIHIYVYVYICIRICISRARDGHQDFSSWRASYCMPYVGAYVCSSYVCMYLLFSISPVCLYVSIIQYIYRYRYICICIYTYKYIYVYSTWWATKRQPLRTKPLHAACWCVCMFLLCRFKHI